MNKKIKLSILSLAAVTMLASCDLDAPTQSSLDASTVFSTFDMAQGEVMAIHQSFAETNSYRGRILMYYGLNTDTEWQNTPQASKSTDEKQSLCNYNTLASNGQMNTANNAYGKLYEGIERANLAIQGLRQYGNIENNKNMAQLLGEALTLRALIYQDLTRMWGDVPARFEPNNNENMYMPRSNRDVIYRQILADLKEAEDYCYWPNENTITSSTERVSKTFVKALRARVALCAGGYGLRGDKYRTSYDPELAPEKMYQIAKEECLDIINSGRNKLGSFKENFTNLCQDVTTAGKESIFEIPFSAGRGRVLYYYGVDHTATYASGGDHITNQGQGGYNGPLPYLFYDYDKDDVRRDITCVPYEWSSDRVSYQKLRAINKWCFGKLRYEWMKSDRALNLPKDDDGINFQYMRLADVYLMAAEAINYLDKDPNTAWNYMAPVLNRVLPADKVAALKAKYTASTDAFFNGIVEQRGLEFAGEMIRKEDLIRWGIIDQKMEEAKAKLTRLANREGEYADLPEKLYYRTVDESGVSGYGIVFDTPKAGETIEVYGLNHGDTDDYGSTLTKNNGFSSKGWFIDGDTKANLLLQDNIDGLYVNQPSTHCLWPIWQTFIDSSNGKLDSNLLSD